MPSTGGIKKNKDGSTFPDVGCCTAATNTAVAASHPTAAETAKCNNPPSKCVKETRSKLRCGYLLVQL